MDTFAHQADIVERSFRSARNIILSRGKQLTTTYKSDGSPVTSTDKAAEQHITDFIRQYLPNIPIYGEEGGYDPESLPDTYWLIDPIDGTKSYIADVPAFTCMGVLVHKDRAVVSIIYNPSTDEMYRAITGHGAYKNDQKIDLRHTELPNQVFCKEQDIEVVGNILSKKSIKASIGPSGAGYGFSLVADGKSAARFHLHSGSHIHDHAPGALLIQEAGGTVIPVFEDNYSLRTRSFIACHPDLADFVRLHLPEIRAIEDSSQALN